VGIAATLLMTEISNQSLLVQSAMRSVNMNMELPIPEQYESCLTLVYS
jgi:hypothetical protein